MLLSSLSRAVDGAQHRPTIIHGGGGGGVSQSLGARHQEEEVAGGEGGCGRFHCARAG